VNLAGVILAAGASSRMGTPKALLEYEGEAFLDRWIRLFANVCRPMIVVLGYDADRIQRGGLRRSQQASFVVNPAPERGMLSSLQTGLRAVPPAAPGVLFTLVDHPLVKGSTVSAVAGAFDTEASPVVIPVYRGERGHPVCIASRIAQEMLALPDQASAKDVMHRHRANTYFLNAEDPGVLADIDDPEAYAAILSQALPR
jgi:molybdenum cofactor cytidylyltransferase